MWDCTGLLFSNAQGVAVGCHGSGDHANCHVAADSTHPPAERELRSLLLDTSCGPRCNRSAFVPLCLCTDHGVGADMLPLWGFVGTACEDKLCPGSEHYTCEQQKGWGK